MKGGQCLVPTIVKARQTSRRYTTNTPLTPGTLSPPQAYLRSRWQRLLNTFISTHFFFSFPHSLTTFIRSQKLRVEYCSNGCRIVEEVVFQGVCRNQSPYCRPGNNLGQLVSTCQLAQYYVNSYHSYDWFVLFDVHSVVSKDCHLGGSVLLRHGLGNHGW